MTETTEIPERLWNFNFVLIDENNGEGKKPLETVWQKKEHRLEDPVLQEHLKKGHNYGIRCGRTSPIVIDGKSYFLIVVDFDKKEFQDKIMPLLPETFTTTSGSPKNCVHLWFASDGDKSFKILDENKETLCDLLAEGKQVIAPGSKHKSGSTYKVIKDLPLAFVSYTELEALLKPHDKTPKKPVKQSLLPKIKSLNLGVAEDIVASVSMEEILQEFGIDTQKNPTNCPLHSSKNGKCLSWTDEFAHCFHCQSDNVGWNKFSFVKEVKNLTSKETFEWFASKTGRLPELQKARKEYNEKAEEEAIKEIEEPKVDTSQFNSLTTSELSKILGLTIKKDEANKIITFLSMLSAYTEDSQINISNNAPSSTGKSYIPLEISDLFPEKDVKIVGYCSPTAFFHDVGTWDDKKKRYVVNLERKILIFLDQPHTLLLQHLRPLLSHDKKEITIKITDKGQKKGLKTKNIIIRGFPSVVFCTAGLKIDEQEATRFILLSPETNQEKIREAIREKIKKDSDKSVYYDFLNSDPGRVNLKERIRAIKQAEIKNIIFTQSVANKLETNFFDRIKTLKPRHQRDIGRIIAFAKTLTMLNVWFRKVENGNLEVNESDVTEAFTIWDSISESQELNLPPYVFNIYKEVIVPCYSELGGGLSRKDILKKHFEVYGRPLQDWMLRQQIIPMLENTGLISQETDPNDKRKILTYPTISLTISQNNSEPDGGVGKNIPENQTNLTTKISKTIVSPRDNNPLNPPAPILLIKVEALIESFGSDEIPIDEIYKLADKKLLISKNVVSYAIEDLLKAGFYFESSPGILKKL